MTKVDFKTFLRDEPMPLVLLHDSCGGVSITNAVEEVCDRLRRMIDDLPRRRIIYRDTLGVWDEIEIDADGRFKAFRLIRARTEAGALEDLVREIGG